MRLFAQLRDQVFVLNLQLGELGLQLSQRGGVLGLLGAKGLGHVLHGSQGGSHIVRLGAVLLHGGDSLFATHELGHDGGEFFQCLGQGAGCAFGLLGLQL